MEGAVLGGRPRRDGALLEGARAIGDDEVGVEVDGVAEALAAGAGAVGVVEGEEAGFGLAVGAMAGGALECGGVAEMLRLNESDRRSFDSGGCASSAQDDSLFFSGLRGAWDGVELNLAGLTIAGFDGVDDARAAVGRNGEAIDEDEDGLGEVEFEERLGSGEFDDLAGLVETVVAAAAEFGETVLECVGYVGKT